MKHAACKSVLASHRDPQQCLFIDNIYNGVTLPAAAAVPVNPYIRAIFWRGHVGIEPTQDALNAPHWF